MKLSLAPRYRLDDDSSWLLAIDPVRRYWIAINGDERLSTEIAGLLASELGSGLGGTWKDKLSYSFYDKDGREMIEEYNSSAERLANWFLESRNKGKKRALKKQKELRKAGIKIRDLEKSREEWKIKAKEYKEKIKRLEEEKKLLKKKGK